MIGMILSTVLAPTLINVGKTIVSSTHVAFKDGKLSVKVDKNVKGKVLNSALETLLDNAHVVL
jgi:hypothetical protein